MKAAEIIQIFKSGDSYSTANYRPISMLSFLSTIFEKLMFAGLDTQNRTCILFTNQFGSAKIKIHQMQLLNSLIMFIHKHSTQLIMTY